MVMITLHFTVLYNLWGKLTFSEVGAEVWEKAVKLPCGGRRWGWLIGDSWGSVYSPHGEEGARLAMARNLPFRPLKQNPWLFSVRELTGLREETGDESTLLCYLLPKRNSAAGPQASASAGLALAALPAAPEPGDSPHRVAACQSGASFRPRGGNTSGVRSSWGPRGVGHGGGDTIGS